MLLNSCEWWILGELKKTTLWKKFTNVKNKKIYKILSFIWILKKWKTNLFWNESATNFQLLSFIKTLIFYKFAHQRTHNFEYDTNLDPFSAF